jgi:hypothetical protein
MVVILEAKMNYSRIKTDTHISRWTLTPLGWIVVFLGALFMTGFCCGLWWGNN